VPPGAGIFIDLDQVNEVAGVLELLPSWSLAKVVAAIQALRGVAAMSAMTLVAEIGDFRRFSNPRHLMAYLGLCPSERSSGAKTARGGITKAGNRRGGACSSKAPGLIACRPA
jgi:transposase